MLAENVVNIDANENTYFLDIFKFLSTYSDVKDVQDLFRAAQKDANSITKDHPQVTSQTGAILDSLLLNPKYGKIVNLGSVSGLLGTAGQANYAASKAGVMALTKVTARELASRGVTCNAIAPGFISTDMTKGLEEQYISQIPMKRAGTPEDVAKVAGFLASPDSDYLTGEVIRIDGGLAIG